MLYIPLYGHLVPSTVRPKYTYPLTTKEKDRYVHFLAQRHIYEPVRSHYEHLDLPLPPLTIERKAQLNTLPMYKGKIGHRNPLPTATTQQTTWAFIYTEGHNLPLTLAQPLTSALEASKYPGQRTPHTKQETLDKRFTAFIDLLRYWDIALLDALDYLLWEYKRTQGLIPVHLIVPNLPRHPEVLDWLDEYSSTPVNSQRF